MKSDTQAPARSPGQGNEAGSGAYVEPRWPVALAILGVLLLFVLMPGRSRLAPGWSGVAIGVALILLMVAVRLGGNRPRGLLRLERAAMLASATVLLAMTFIVVGFLVVELIYQPTKYTGQQLLTAGIESWGDQRAGVLDRLLGRRPRRS